MITVIIAEKETLELFDEFEIFLRPMMHSDHYVTCEWNKAGKTVSEMLPTLYEIVEHHNEWRAIIVRNDGLHQVNPFDYTQYADTGIMDGGKVDWSQVMSRRENRFRCYERAINNPFTKLTTALCGMPSFDLIVEDREVYEGILSGEIPLYQYMLESQLEALEPEEVAAVIDAYRRPQLTRFIEEGDAEALLTALKERDSGRLIELVGEDHILEFIRFIGNFDPQYSDPEYMECVVENTYKLQLYATLEQDFVLRDKMPREVICVAPRTYDVERHEQNVKWEEHEEASYSRFAEFNLYPEKLRFLIFDIISRHNRQYTFDQMRMVCFLLLLAENPLPAGSVNAKRVYRANVDFNPDAVKKACAAYLSKLKATDAHVRELNAILKDEIVTDIDNDTAQQLFESEVQVPVEIESSFDRTTLYAKSREIGLSKDCPGDEEEYWKHQAREISRNFTRYMREPRRALKYAVRNEMGGKSAIEDERIRFLTERQKEDVALHMLDEEEKMVEAKTPSFFNSRRFMKRIEKADRHIRKGIEQRMTRKRTVCTGLVGLGVFFLGLLPLVLGNLKSLQSFLTTLAILGGSLGVLAIIAFIFIVTRRKLLLRRFDRFNQEMGGIMHEIDTGLAAYSEYLSHACNVMRGFSVLNYTEKCRISRENIIKKHIYDIDCKIAEINALFYGYIDLAEVRTIETDPYEYDYTVLKDYEYEMPYLISNNRVPYVQIGHTIDLPVDYVKSVSLTREELYD